MSDKDNLKLMKEALLELKKAEFGLRRSIQRNKPKQGDPSRVRLAMNVEWMEHMEHMIRKMQKEADSKGD